MATTDDDPTAQVHEELPTYPGARRPDRRRWVSASGGLRIAVSEWGPPDAPPLLLAHGGFDFAGTMDRFAPLLVAGGWRVVGWDQRGHGDSEHAALYHWEADVRDAQAVLDSVSRHPVPLVGHSKGGGIVLQLADSLPHRVSHLVNLDGLPSRRNWPDVPDHDRARLLTSEVRTWLDHRHKPDAPRRPGTIAELAERRRYMNPRLPLDWLRYLVPIGAERGDDGWRWKVDPMLRFGGFGPWRPEWTMWRMPGLAVPVLGVLGLEGEMLGWGTQPEDVLPWLPPGARFVPLEGVGHFVHVEQPDLVASLVLDFLGDPPPAPPGGWGAGATAPDPELEALPPPGVASVPARPLAGGRGGGGAVAGGVELEALPSSSSGVGSVPARPLAGGRGGGGGAVAGDVELEALPPGAASVPAGPLAGGGGGGGAVAGDASVPAGPLAGGGGGGGALAGVGSVPAGPLAGGGGGGGAVAGTTWLRHRRVDLALHELDAGPAEGGVRPLLLLHGLGERSPAVAPPLARRWPGPVHALDLTGHGASTVPRGGGYSAEVLLADAALAVRHLGEVTVVGRGLGAYVALLLSAALPELVRGTLLLDGPGTVARSVGPGPSTVARPDPAAAPDAAPDPFALAELSADIRTADYAAVLTRMALQASPLDNPIAVAMAIRPPWVAAVVDEPGVLDLTPEDALARFAAQRA